MKRSKTIMLTLLTGASLMVVGCNEEEDKTRFYKDNAACMQELQDSNLCATAEKEAQAAHLESAPKFTSKAECEQKFGAGNCVEPATTPAQATNQPHNAGVSHGGSFFMPMMMGYMMGKMSGGGGLLGGGLFGGNRYGAQPLYRDNNGNAYSGNGMAGFFRGNNFQATPHHSSNWSNYGSGNSSSVRRGGFGSSSHFSGS
ncbi:MAG: DUF1190 domain-containing protein [Alphaproteobacteria bacterium]